MILCVSAGAFLFCTASASADTVPPVAPVSQTTPAPKPPQNEVTGSGTETTVSNPGVLEQFGPPGVLITTVLTGILMIIKSINEGKKIDVTAYKERAADAENRSNEEIGKVHKKLEELERKMDEVIADRDSYRDLLEARKAYFTQQLLDMEKRHQKEIEEMHGSLVAEINTRHRLERLLAENGIPIPEAPAAKAADNATTVG